MSLQTLAWLSMAAYAIHIMEEYTFDWRNWARAIIKLPVEWSDFYVTNAIVIALGIAQGRGLWTSARSRMFRLVEGPVWRALQGVGRLATAFLPHNAKAVFDDMEFGFDLRGQFRADLRIQRTKLAQL